MNNKTTYYPKNKKEKLLNWAKEYYENSKERLRITKQRKNVKKECGRNKYQNMSEKNKQRLKEHQKRYLKAKKST